MPTPNRNSKEVFVKHQKVVPYRLQEQVSTLSCGNATKANQS